MNSEVLKLARDRLRELGLSRHEASAYLALLTMGEMTPRDVSEATGIPYTKVYDVLRRLERKGWVVAVSEGPLLYSARRPDDVLESLRQDFEKKLSEVKDLLNVFEEGVGLTPPSSIYVIRRTDTLEKIVRSTVNAAKEIVYALVATNYMSRLFATLRKYPRVKVIVRRGVPAPQVGELRSLDILLPLDLVIADYKRLVLSFSALIGKAEPKICGVLVIDEEVARTATEYFNALWAAAKK